MLRRMRRHLLSAIVTLTSLPCFGAGFHALSLPGSQLDAMSADGRSAAGCLVGGKGGGFRWQEGESPEILTGAMSVRAISPSGHYVAGSALDADQHEIAAFWDAEGVAHPIGSLPGAD